MLRCTALTAPAVYCGLTPDLAPTHMMAGRICHAQKLKSWLPKQWVWHMREMGPQED